MWHEARRREKATQKLLTDHRKRAEKRREEDRIDPNSLLQVHGFKSKLYHDLNAHKQVTKSLVSWQGDSNVTIDRFDVRATLTSLPVDDHSDRRQAKQRDGDDAKRKASSVVDIDETESMKKLLMFERYRLLMQNDLMKMPEENRLTLVSKSECFTDARLRKLQRNKFGTSGETTTTLNSKTSQIVHLSGGKNAQTNRTNQQPSSRQRAGVSIGFNYNQSTQKCHNLAEDHETQQPTRNIIDLDDYVDDDGEIDLDDVSSSSRLGSKRTSEVVSKYGLTNKEFDLLQSQEERNMKQSDLLKELKRLRDKKAQDSSLVRESSMAAEVYGPALPPEMLSKISQRASTPSSSSSSSQHSPPVGQRSPSGANIPMRNGCQRLENNDEDDHLDEAFSSPKTSPLQATAPQTQPVEAKPIHFSYIRPVGANVDHARGNGVGSLMKLERRPDVSPKPSTSQDKSSTERTNCDTEKSVNDNTDQPAEKVGSRRAATPLAYRRHRRSSRSLSRDRRISSSSSTSSSSSSSSSYHGSTRHRDKRKRAHGRGSSPSNSSRSTHSDTSSTSGSESSCSTSSSFRSRDNKSSPRRQHSRFKSTRHARKHPTSSRAVRTSPPPPPPPPPPPAHRRHRSRAKR